MSVDIGAADGGPALARPGRGDAVQIVDLDPSHLAEAARLYAAEFRRLRGAVPALPPGFLDPEMAEPLLRRAISAGPAVAAIRDGQLAGYMAGFPVPRLRGSGTGVHVPEWAHGATGGDRSEVYESLYTAISARWAEAGWLCHCLSIFPGDPELGRALAWFGFGLFPVDAVRGLNPLGAAAPDGVKIDRATPDDVDHLLPLAMGHDAYYCLAPTFLIRDDNEDPREELARWIETPGESVWFSRLGSRALSFIYLRPPHDDVCQAVRHPGTISIGGAFTVPDARRTGVGTTLLSRVIEWASSAGFERLSVDFETANVLARRFWLRAFDPICLSFERHLDDRLARPRPESDR
ncbi:MAG TPA: GNAT family N-acetyltransferase [Candidatus Limnocylindrales bacterium]|jgi:GNAT superfamily N-acetyltransferase